MQQRAKHRRAHKNVVCAHTVTGHGGDWPSVLGKRQREGTPGLLSTCKGECASTKVWPLYVQKGKRMHLKHFLKK